MLFDLQEENWEKIQALVCDTKSCSIPNGAGTQTWNGSARGTCSVTSCNTNFHKEGNACVSNTKQVACTQNGAPINASYIIANVTTTWNGSSRSLPANCNRQCNTGYQNNHGQCDENNTTPSHCFEFDASMGKITNYHRV